MRHNKNIFILCYKQVLIYTMATLAFFSATAAPGDTTRLVRKYVSIANGYKKMPVHVSIDIQNSSNVIFSPTDTAKTHAEFYVYKEGTFINTGNTMQLANDSLVLFIQNGIKLMSLSTGRKKFGGAFGHVDAQMSDSAVQEMAQQYTADTLPTTADSGFIKLSSRTLIQGIQRPAQTMELIYNPATSLPTEAIQTRRLLLKIDSSKYNTFLQNPVYTGKIITTPDGGHFVFVEKKVTFIYTDMAFDNSRPLPLKMTDCVLKNASGSYVPANGFAQYNLKQGY